MSTTRNVKSKKRVKDFGEVFTNEREVKAMCDLIPKEVWENISSTFLEPSCGTGNFIVEILTRKFNHCNGVVDGLKALSSVVGLELQGDNVVECRTRCLDLFTSHFNPNPFSIALASSILLNNIRQCDSLKQMQDWIDQNNLKENCLL